MIPGRAARCDSRLDRGKLASSIPGHLATHAGQTVQVTPALPAQAWVVSAHWPIEGNQGDKHSTSAAHRAGRLALDSITPLSVDNADPQGCAAGDPGRGGSGAQWWQPPGLGVGG